MQTKVTIVFNKPSYEKYNVIGEARAITSVMDEVRAVHRALAELGYPVTKLPLSPPLEQVWETIRPSGAELVFNLFEGFEGLPETEAIVANILAELGIPFTGNPASALSLALDKVKTKEVLEADGIETPRCQILCPDDVTLFRLDFPCIVKPLRADASHGLSEESVVSNFEQLERQVAKISQFFGGGALVEEFVDGREFNLTVLGNDELVVLPVAEMIYSLPPHLPKLLTFAAKWRPGTLYFKNTHAVCPAEIGSSEQKQISQIALTAFKLVGCRGYARVDMRQDAEGRLKVLEVNPNPDITPGYGMARQAEAAGMTYIQLIEKIVMLALEKHPCFQS